MNLEATFTQLKILLKPYEPQLQVKTDDSATYYLEHKSTSGKKAEMFAAVMIKKNYASLYYMPVYYQPSLLDDISPNLKKHMQGKSCFNFTDPHDPAIDELAKLLARSAVS